MPPYSAAMSTREDYPPGVPCWADCIQPDPAAAARFYSGLFGWECTETMPADSPGHYLMARIDGRDTVALSSGPPEGSQPAAWRTYIRVTSADDAAQAVTDAGGQVLAAPLDIFDAGRAAVCADPQGAEFAVWQPARHRGSAAVNEHGAVGFNNLYTDDLAGASAFYGQVFGWGVLSMRDGSRYWTLPGYGDHLETLTPGLREGMAQLGADVAFVDAVARILLQTRGPARWGLSFAVDDVEVAAATALGLGGQVLSPPQDAPWVRYATLADPAGAVFTASQFVAENT